MVFADESRVTLDPTIGSQWSLKGRQPEFPSDSRGRGQGINLIGHVEVRSKDAFAIPIVKGNSISFIDFMSRLSEKYKHYDRVWLYIDNARFHKSKEVWKWVESQNRIFLCFFPPYSPKLNPTEWEWKEMRRKVTHGKRFNSKEECCDVICKYFLTRIGASRHTLCQLN